MKKTVLILSFLCLWTTQSFALDLFSKIVLRDTLIGMGAGLAIGLIRGPIFPWLLVGSASGAIFGYVDAEKGLTASQDELTRAANRSLVQLDRLDTKKGPILAYRVSLVKFSF